jgi:DNA polymerase-3 subunit epsilon
MFPGKRNNLDALCDRLGVDNSGRALHGALLDAELLADVFINMTRGQDALLMEAVDEQTSGLQMERVDLRGLALTILYANQQELAAHVEVIHQIDKASGGNAIWKEAA